MLNIIKVIDVYGWAYDFIGRDMAKYSSCRIKNQLYNQVNLDKQDLVIISSPNIMNGLTNITIPNLCKDKGIKVIGQYCGECDMVYQYADLIVTISPQLYLYAKEKYKDTGIPVIFLPESIDTRYFQPSEHYRGFFNPGWCGGASKSIKRTNILEKLKYPVKIQSKHGSEYFREGRTQDHMLDFYKSIDCFVNVSETECMSRAILEAIACGLPVISTDVGGIHLQIQDEFIVPTYPTETVIEEVNKKLTVLASDFELREGIGKVNRAWAETVWSWQVNMPLWDEVFFQLHQGNIRRIIEISDSCIGSFPKYFQPCEKYTEQIKHFSKSHTDRRATRLPVQEERFAHITKNLITDLSVYTGDYWVARETCLDTINHQKIKLTPGKIYLGVKSEQDKMKLEDFLFTLNVKGDSLPLKLQDLEIYIIVEDVKDTKFMPIYGCSVKVPSPVMPYLANRFGYSWRLK